jgi:hypothetical protein
MSELSAPESPFRVPFLRCFEVHALIDGQRRMTVQLLISNSKLNHCPQAQALHHIARRG